MNNYNASPLFQSNLPDETLLSRLKEGDEKAFTAIYIRYNKMLYVLAYKYLKDSFRAEDIVQQVFLKLWEARSLFAGAINLRNYLYTSAKNLILNEIRDNFSDMEKNYAVIQNRPEFEDKLQSALEEKDLFQHFYKILAELPEQKRKVCLLKIRDNLSNQDCTSLCRPLNRIIRKPSNCYGIKWDVCLVF